MNFLNKFTKVFLATVLSLVFSGCGNSNQNNMSIFERLFGKKEKVSETPKPLLVSRIAKTSEMLDEERFWAIIDRSLKNTKSQDEQEQFLTSEIEKLSPEEMIGFRLRTDKLLYDTYYSEMWCAAYIMNGGASDDGFEYFRCWLISRGKDVYYQAKSNPDYLVNEIVNGTEFYEFESFWYVALTAFKNKTGKDLYEYIDYDKFKTHEGKYPQFEFNWKEEKPETMKKICPKLFAKLWK
jgi:hypothetical protein